MKLEAWGRKIVSKLQNFHQKPHLATNAEQMLTNVADVPDILKRVIPSDATWANGYADETRTRSFQCKFPEEAESKKTLRDESKEYFQKVLFDYNKIVQYVFCTLDRTVLLRNL